ncbi:LacI family DNA-binding transcriptional regulator [Pseudomonas syringae]|uniref:LacI family DNA-binding transcriptional regulator n=1 Tax=Pseudomonas syringae TaxID=317 RepID=UPI0034D4AAD1
MKDNGPKGTQATIVDVAREAGVSRATASRALGGYGYAGSEARNRVLDAAKRLGYQPNLLARSMVTGRSKMIGVVVADIENLYFARAIRAITDTARAKGFGVVLATTDEDIDLEREAVRVLLANRVDGLIVSPTSSIEVDHLVAAQDMECPLVLLDRRVPALNADTFAVDNFRAAHQAVSSLISQKHRRIALVSNAPSHGEQQFLISSVRERIDGYRAALHEAKIQVDPEFIILGGWDTENLARQLGQLCQSPNRPSAFLATDSSVGLVLLKVLRELDLAIPDQVSLICFDDADWTTAVTPSVTVVSQPIRDLAKAATEELVGRMQGKITGAGKETLLPATLIERNSVSSVFVKPPAEST